MIKKILTIIILSTITIVANGEIISTLYSANTNVDSDSGKDRNVAFSRALKSVLIKVSGNSKIVTNPQIYHINARQYVNEYKYISIPKENDQIELLLHATFNKLSTDKLIRKLGYFSWSENRPIVMIWLAIKTSNNEQIIGNDSDQTIVNTLKNASYKKGLLILLPILDISDLQHIDYKDISEIKTDTIKQASKRYAPDEIFIAHINTSNKNNITGDFTLIRKTNQLKWKIRGNNINDVINLGLNHATVALAERLTNENITNSIKLVIKNLNNMDDYIKTMGYLNKLHGVKKIDVLNISKKELNVRLSFNIDVQSLINEIKKDSLLESTKIDNNNLVLHCSLHKTVSLGVHNDTPNSSSPKSSK